MPGRAERRPGPGTNEVVGTGCPATENGPLNIPSSANGSAGVVQRSVLGGIAERVRGIRAAKSVESRSEDHDDAPAHLAQHPAGRLL